MKRKLINKIVAATVVATTLCTLTPIRASAEWVNDYQGNWYYLQDNTKLTGWKKIDGQTYYFDGNGKMLTGWTQAGSSWYYLQDNGALKTGWINFAKNYYYADADGVIQTGVLNIAGKIYVFDKSGIMRTRDAIINGEFYTLDSNGAVLGDKVPTPDKEYDISGKLVQYIKNTDKTVSNVPIHTRFNDVIKDNSFSDDDPNEGRIFKITFRDSDGSEIKTKSIKYGKSIDLFEPSKFGYNFAGWNTRSDGSGKDYSSSDDIDVKDNLTLYAQWNKDATVKVGSITIKGNSFVTINKTTQMTAEISPSDATSKSVKWSVTDGSGKATIDSNGVLTGVATGTVTIKATFTDGSNVSATKQVTVTAADVIIPVAKIIVTSQTSSYAISTKGGKLQMVASIIPSDASNQKIKWEVEKISGSASVDENGLVTAISDGAIVVKAIAQDTSRVVGRSQIITITGQSNSGQGDGTSVPVTSVKIYGNGDGTVSGTKSETAGTINTDASLGKLSGTLQLTADILPANATYRDLKWSVDNEAIASVSIGGIVTAKANGTVKVKATSKDGKVVSNVVTITIRNQTGKLTTIGVKELEKLADGKIKMQLTPNPADSVFTNVKWSIGRVTNSKNEGYATINSDGILTPIAKGDVLVIVTATANDGTSVSGSIVVTITDVSGTIPLTGIKVTGKDGVMSISTDDGTLQMVPEFDPYYATGVSAAGVTWTVIPGSGNASIDANGLLTAKTNGYVTVKATYGGISGISKQVWIGGQIDQVTDIVLSTTPAGAQVAVNNTVQMNAKLTPSEPTDKRIIWSVENIAGDTGDAQFVDSNGLPNNKAGILKGKAVGKIRVVATAENGSGISKNMEITIIPEVLTTGITVTSSSAAITSSGQKVDLKAVFADPQPTNKKLKWTVEYIDGDDGKVHATIVDKGVDSSGNGIAELTPLLNGKVKVTAAAQDGSGIANTCEVDITGQPVATTGYKVTASDDVTNTITTDNGTLNMKATVTPSDATNKPSIISWSVEDARTAGSKMTGIASIDSSGKLTAIADGTVRVKATGTTTDGTVISGYYDITLSGQVVPIEKIDDITYSATTVSVGKTIELTPVINPTYANGVLEWLVDDNTLAVVDTKGRLTTKAKGTVQVTVRVKDNPTIIATRNITIS